MSRSDLKRMYIKMLLIRRFEEFLDGLFKDGLIFGTTHCYIGQEAIAVGVLSCLNQDDIVVSNHRGHGHFIAFTGNIEGLLSEIMGREDGVCGGRGGSQHLHYGNFYSNGITGGMIPVATGMALAEKLKGSNRRVVAFLGDGALAQGVVYESWNMASLWHLPILYVVENNHYAMSTRIDKHMAGDILTRAFAFGMQAKRIESSEVEVVNQIASEIFAEMGKGTTPQVLLCDTYRFCGHSKSDDLCYRTRQEEEFWLEKDPIVAAERKLALSEDEKDIIAADIEAIIKRAMHKSEASGFQSL